MLAACRWGVKRGCKKAAGWHWAAGVTAGRGAGRVLAESRRGAGTTRAGCRRGRRGCRRGAGGCGRVRAGSGGVRACYRQGAGKAQGREGRIQAGSRQDSLAPLCPARGITLPQLNPQRLLGNDQRSLSKYSHLLPGSGRGAQGPGDRSPAPHRPFSLPSPLPVPAAGPGPPASRLPPALRGSCALRARPRRCAPLGSARLGPGWRLRSLRPGPALALSRLGSAPRSAAAAENS